MAAKNAITYLKATSNLGISFHKDKLQAIEAFIKFPLSPEGITSFSDANWGSQDQSVPKPYLPSKKQLPFVSRSISGFLLFHHGPIHWSSRRQAITARSSAESEIYATDECVKYLQYIKNIVTDLELQDLVIPTTISIFNDNQACVDWSHTLTTKGLRHITIRENAVRENTSNQFIDVKHIEGKVNPSDLFTKEDRDRPHFISIRDLLVSPPFVPTLLQQCLSL